MSDSVYNKYLYETPNYQTDWNESDESSVNYLKNKPEFSFCIKDTITGYTYAISIEEGRLVTQLAMTSLKVTKLPDKIDYIEGESLNIDGMIVTAFFDDGSSVEIPNSDEWNNIIVNDSKIVLNYRDHDTILSTVLEVNIIDWEIALIDFDYTVQDDGTYLITGWKGTLNGEPSTKMVVPDSNLILI